MQRIAPEIFRKRLLVEGYFERDEVTERTILDYLEFITSALSLRAYAAPIVHKTSGQGKVANDGYDAFVPLIDSGIYICVWSGPRFLSCILYTCADFDEATATELTREFFRLSEVDSFLF
jgi:hypothetical protein